MVERRNGHRYWKQYKNYFFQAAFKAVFLLTFVHRSARFPVKEEGNEMNGIKSDANKKPLNESIAKLAKET